MSKESKTYDQRESRAKSRDKNLPKKVYIRTFGCQMNLRDSEFAMGILLDSGFRKAGSVDDADVILFNSCSVRKHAEDRLFSNIAELNNRKKKRPGLVVGLIGCTAQNYKDKALEKAPIVDFVTGPGNIGDIPAIIKDILKNRCPIIATDKVDKNRPELFPEYREGDFKAYVSISEGCDNFCSYCIVPYVRGRERSRDAMDIIREVKDLAARGFKEITLLGQNVNSYGGNEGINKGGGIGVYKGKNFIRLLERLNSIKGIERIRFMTSHPKDASPELFMAMRDLEKVCEHLHLPLQSGSDRVLKLMNRGYSRDKYLKLVRDYKKILPGGAITTDIIAGFPSESENDFKATLDIMKKIGFDSAFIFKYSPRPPAASVKLEDDVPEEAKGERLVSLLDLQCKASLEKNNSMKGIIAEILVDGYNKKAPSSLTGRTRTNRIAVFEGGKSLIGDFVSIKINAASPHALKGRIV